MPLCIRNLSPTDVIHQDTLLWKYVKFEKFLDFLLMKRLYFRRVDKLDDPYECLMAPDAMARAMAGKSQAEVDVIARHQRYLETERTKAFVSCWHASDHESEAMWKLFGGDGHSIAITARLSVFLAALSGENLTVGKVLYKDLATDHLDMTDIFDFAMIKRRPFEHEKEFRLLYVNTQGPDNPELIDGNGYYLRIEPERIVERIYVSPLSEAWQVELTDSIARQHGLAGTVIKSDLL